MASDGTGELCLHQVDSTEKNASDVNFCPHQVDATIKNTPAFKIPSKSFKEADRSQFSRFSYQI